MKFALAAVGLLAALTQAHAASMDFHIKNSTGKMIQVRMFSQSRAWMWPGATSGYDQKKNDLASYSITCNAGEKVCYGAWPKKKPNSWEWGVGVTGKSTCTACCYTCGANTGVITLTKPSG